jgi:2-polyprenyl-3-methyl-5-hydroxy-6-metoxy-1,4-benzoquinol methylase
VTVLGDGQNARTRERANARTDSDFRDALYRRYVSTFKGERTGSAFDWWDHKYLPLLSDLDRSAPILEIGCGDGSLLAYLARRGFSHAIGIDISEEQVALARGRDVHAEVHDIFAFLEQPQHTGAFAAILAVDVLEHFSRSEVTRLAPLLNAALHPRGRLLIQTANGAGILPGQVIYGDLTHLTIFTPQSLGQLLRPVGFSELTFYETGPVPIRLRGKLDLAAWLAIKACLNAVRRIETGKRQAIWTENFICRAFTEP